jgi:hypothetical protein
MRKTFMSFWILGIGNFLTASIGVFCWNKRGFNKQNFLGAWMSFNFIALGFCFFT